MEITGIFVHPPYGGSSKCLHRLRFKVCIWVYLKVPHEQMYLPQKQEKIYQ